MNKAAVLLLSVNNPASANAWHLRQCFHPLEMHVFSGVYSCPLLQCVYLIPCITCLPLRHISRMLSVFVPKKRCSGFTHSRLSQVWQTNNPVGMSPFMRKKESLWIVIVVCSISHLPYPVAVTAPGHSQQPSPPAAGLHLRRIFLYLAWWKSDSALNTFRDFVAVSFI